MKIDEPLLNVLTEWEMLTGVVTSCGIFSIKSVSPTQSIWNTVTQIRMEVAMEPDQSSASPICNKESGNEVIMP
jgi:hypothetical protein